MSTPTFTRRRLLKSSALVSLGGLTGACGFFRRGEEPAILSAAADITDHYFGLVLDKNGQLLREVGLPVRGHAAAYNTHRDEVLFLSRRPGTQLFVFSTKSDRKRVVEAGPGRHFYGHGVLSQDERYLFTTENDFEAGLGVIAVRDAGADYRVVRELPSHGVGPHELVLLDEQVLAVANGGIKTHPAYHREELNIDSMEPSVTFLNWQSGELLGRFVWSNPQISLRHLAKLDSHRVVVAAQSHDAVSPDQSLVFEINRDGQGRAMSTDDLFAPARRHYIASIAQVDERTTITTSPRSGHIDIWLDGTWSDAIACFDVAGVCRTGEGKIFVSNGRGELLTLEQYDAARFSISERQRSKVRWDNHLVSLT